MIEDDRINNSEDNTTSQPAIFFMPVEMRVEDNEQGRKFVERISKSNDDDENNFVDLISESTIVIGTPDDVTDIGNYILDVLAAIKLY